MASQEYAWTHCGGIHPARIDEEPLLDAAEEREYRREREREWAEQTEEAYHQRQAREMAFFWSVA